MIGRAKRMVAQCFDDAAVRYFTARALRQNPLQFDLERAQPRKTTFNLGQLRDNDCIGRHAGLAGLV